MRTRPIFGILVDWLENEYQNKVLAGVEETARKHGANLLCFVGGALVPEGESGGARNFVYELANSRTVDGLVLMSGAIETRVGSEELARYCERFRPLPMCSIGSELPGIPGVLVDNARGMRALLDHLLGVHGYRRLAFIRGPQASAEAESRFWAYRSALEEAGIPLDPSLVVSGDFVASSGAAAVRELVEERRVQFDVVVAASDEMALGAIDALQTRGIRVPSDVAVVGFDDIESARSVTAPLTTVRQPFREQGAQALLAVLGQRRGENVSPRRVLRTQLVVRQSCGCPPQTALPLGHYQIIEAAPTLSATLLQHRGRLVADMAQAVRGLQGTLETIWGERLIDALRGDLDGIKVGGFLGTLEEILTIVSTLGGNVAAWHGAVSVLRHHARSSANTDPGSWQRAEELWHEARILITLVAERAQAQQRLAAAALAHTLRLTFELLASAFDVAAIPEILKQQLPQLRIKSFYFVLLDGETEGPWAHLVGAHDASGRPLVCSGEPFAWTELLPPGLLPVERRTTYVVEPVFFEEESLGYLLLEMGPTQGDVYETLRDQVGSAVKSALLFHRLEEHGAHREQLEERWSALELELAARVQLSLLPEDFYSDYLQVAARMIPSRVPGGNYYDILPVENGCWIGVGDVVGRGLATSVVALTVRNALAALVVRSPKAAPSDLLRSVNIALYQTVRDRLHEDLHASLSLIHIDPSGRMIFAGAHEEIVVCRARDGKCFTLPTPGTWVGAVLDVSRSMVDTQCQLEPQDIVLLYSDGVLEARSSEGEPFGLARLCATLEQGRQGTVERVREQILEAVHRWAGAELDDLTVLVLRFTPLH